MKQIQFKKLLPHLVAIGIFLLVTLIFCKPALDPELVMKQGDVTGWQGMSHQSFVYKEKHGHLPLWITSMFSGMPAYQVAIEGDWSPLSVVDKAFQLWLPQPMNFFFLACIGFYFLCICLRIRPYASIIGALGFAYCSFSPIIVTAGHNTQMLALGYAPAVIGAVILIFDKKYLSGFILTAMLTALQIGQGHQQISYYLLLILLAMGIAYTIRFIKNGEMPHLLKSTGLLLIAGIIGVAVNAINLLPTYDFAKYSKRGGQLVMDGNSRNNKETVKDGKTTGLSKDYAFMWSYGRAESFSLLIPGVQGYGLHIAQRDDEQYIFPKLSEKSNVANFFVEKLNAPEDQAANYAMQQSGSIYWGGQPFTNGPVYLGAIICFLFILGMFLLDGKHKWWILAASVLGILLSWGHNLQGFNYFMFDYFPLYNKFRVPTMAMTIPQMLFPIVASLVMEKLMSGTDQSDWKKFLRGTVAMAAVFAAALLFYAGSDFSRENKARTAEFNKIYNEAGSSMETRLAELDKLQKPETDNQLYEGMVMNFKGNPDAPKMGREFLTALRKDRTDFFLTDFIRSFMWVLIAATVIALYLKKKISALVMLAATTLFSAVDLLGFGMKYLNDKSFDYKDKYEASEFPLSKADEMILADTDPNYRVFNTASLEESRTSYYHKSIGGYHPAKLGIYDDLIMYQLSGQPNINVVNMLNAKYIIQRRGNEPVAMRNPGALGNAWFVKGARFVNGPVEEMKALDILNPADSAVIDASFQSKVPAFVPADSSASIRQKTFDNDAITYETSSQGNHLAVFSEVYYKDWKAYIDGKPADYVKANYVLRAMVVPAGKHTVEFRFEPAIFYTSKRISFISSWLLALLFIGFLALQFRQGAKEENTKA
jgi:hypothetical protein